MYVGGYGQFIISSTANVFRMNGGSDLHIFNRDNFGGDTDSYFLGSLAIDRHAYRRPDRLQFFICISFCFQVLEQYCHFCLAPEHAEIFERLVEKVADHDLIGSKSKRHDNYINIRSALYFFGDRFIALKEMFLVREGIFLDRVEVGPVVKDTYIEVHFGHQFREGERTMSPADDVELVFMAETFAEMKIGVGMGFEVEIGCIGTRRFER